MGSIKKSPMSIYSLNLLVNKSGLLYAGLHLIFCYTYNILIEIDAFELKNPPVMNRG